jgi:hypothetical protein
MAPHEVAGLQALARAQGGSLTINPDTGLAEAGFLSDLFKAALPMAAGWALGPAGFQLMSSLGAAATVGGISALASGSLSKGITAGLGAYGGSELATGLGNFGDSSLTGLAAQAPSSAVGGMDPAQRAASAIAGNAPAADNMSRVFGGAKAAFNNPSAFTGSMGGLGNVAKNVGMAAAPILTMPTATQMPATGSQNTAFIRTSKRDPATGALVQDEAIPASEWGTRDIGPYNYYGANRMATGGTVETTTKMPGDSDSARAYNYLMGLGPNPIIGGAPALPPPPKEKEKDVAGGAPSGIPALIPISETGGGNDAGQPGGGWGGKTVGEKAAFFAENEGWAKMHEKMLNMVPFNTQAKRDEQAALNLAKSKAQAEADLNPNLYGGGFGVPGATTTPAGAMIAANPMAVDPQQAAQAKADAEMSAAVAAAQANAAAQTQAAADAAAQAGAQAQADQSARDAATSSAAPTGLSGLASYGREGDAPGGGGFSGGDGVATGGNEGSDGGRDASGGGDRGTRGGFATGGITALAQGGMSGLGSYSDGGRLLKGPGDGVSDDIPAHIGDKMQPARLADGEFVVPARIVSELGNGSTEAGARQLYKMMERIQAGRAKTTGKNKVAVNSRAAKHLPA